jgi:hypothetical protein
VCESTPEEEIAPGGTIDVRRRVASARPDRSSVYVQIYSAEQLRKNEKKKKNETIQQSVRSIISLTARSSCCHHRSVYSAYSICPAVPFQSKKKTQNRKAKNKSNPWNRIVSFMQRLKKRGGGFRIQDR